MSDSRASKDHDQDNNECRTETQAIGRAKSQSGTEVKVRLGLEGRLRGKERCPVFGFLFELLSVCDDLLGDLRHQGTIGRRIHHHAHNHLQY